MAKKRETAAEFMARLQSDPEWVRKDAERKAKHKAAVEKLQQEIEPEHAPLMAELAAAGVKVRPNIITQWESGGTVGPEPRFPQSISDLVNTKDSYPEAIPILIKHLRTVRHLVLVNTIARALTVKEARGSDAAGVILEKLKQIPNLSGTDYKKDFQARWALANALVMVADAKVAEPLKMLVQDASYQDVKERLETALKKLKRK